MKSVGISDSIQNVFNHFDEALAQTIIRTGYLPQQLRQTPQIEGLNSIKNKVVTLFRSLLWPIKAEKCSNKLVFQVWPTLGCWEVLLWRKSKSIVFMHDPVPLRKQIGFSSSAKLMAKTPLLVGKCKVLSLSHDGLVRAQELFPLSQNIYAPHPIKTTVHQHQATGMTISIVGQYKQARDIQLIEELGERLTAKGYKTKIWGRGWPTSLSHWEVNSRFLSESELDQVIIDSRLIVLPYSFFFQSGIAIRALELGRLSVSIDNSFMRELFGQSSPNIVDGLELDNWTNAVMNSCKISEEEIAVIRQKYTSHVDEIWEELLNAEMSMEK